MEEGREGRRKIKDAEWGLVNEVIESLGHTARLICELDQLGNL